MSEYLEAISRLNMPERTPGTTISRAQYPIPRKDTPYNYDRILKETLNTPLPKYAIPQRIFINNDGSKTYTFPLDKQFTLAKGGRKSIAVREVNLEQQFTYNNPTIFCNYTINFHYDDPNNQGTIIAGQITNAALGYQYSNNAISFISEINSMASAIKRDINNRINALNNNILNPCDFIIIDENTLRFTFNENVNLFYVDYGNSSMELSSLAVNKLGLKPNVNYPFTVHVIYPQQIPSNDNYFEFIFNNHTGSANSLCSTLNPWSVKNIVASIDRFYPNLNKLFPYDNTQEIKIWLINSDSNILYNYNFKGYIDLELIIDNLNNFAMDD